MADSWFSRDHPPLLVVLSGTAGSGKDSVVRRMQERGIPFEFIVTCTTRPPRPGEENGRDYFFVSDPEFQELIRRGDLLEHAEVYGHQYGNSKTRVRQALAAGRDALLRIDVQGVDTIRRKCPEAVTIFLAASSEEELTRRLRKRGSETAEQVALRLRAAREEMRRIPDFDYVVINADGKLDATVDTIAAILRAEHARAIPRILSL
ncbi:MAG: guanylate kinase [Anaerolineales bacterium]|jgi:guanylate kinase